MADSSVASGRLSVDSQIPERPGRLNFSIVERIDSAYSTRSPERLPSALRALANLMDAASVDLLYRAGSTGLVTRWSGSLDGEVAADVAAAMPADEGADYIPVGQGAWLSPDGGNTIVLFVKLIERRAGTAWAVIGFNSGVEARQRLHDSMPTFITLLLSYATIVITLEEARYQVRATMAALNQHDCGTFIVDSDHRLMFANTAGQNMLDHRIGFCLRRAKLGLLGYQDGVRFETALDFVMEAGGKDARAGMALLLHVPDHERPMAIGIVPMDLGHVMPETGRNVALVHAALPRSGVERGLDVVCCIHGLSPVETQLVCHLVAGMTVAEAAVEMRVKVDTARAYLKQIFIKTSTNRQSSLIRLVTNYQRALRGNVAFTAI